MGAWGRWLREVYKSTRHDRFEFRRSVCDLANSVSCVVVGSSFNSNDRTTHIRVGGRRLVVCVCFFKYLV